MNGAFARVRKFLDYHPGAKWTAIVASVGTGVLFVGLLVVLALFVDLMIHRGRIPCYANLSAPEKSLFLNALPTDTEQIQQQLKEMDLGDEKYVKLATEDPSEAWSYEDQMLRRSLLWFVYLQLMLEDTIGEDAAAEMQQQVRSHVERLGPVAALNRDMQDMGAVSLAVASQNSLRGFFTRQLVAWNPWMWRGGNMSYLLGLFVLGLGIALVRTALIFIGNVCAAKATVEAVTRLRRAAYHHTFRLGALAINPLVSSVAISVATRHLESINDGLYAWQTVVFREPVKFFLIFLFALAVHFWLALAFLLLSLLVWLMGSQVSVIFRRQRRNATKRAAETLALIQESLGMLRLAKAYLMELFNQRRIEGQLVDYSKAQMERYRSESIYRPVLAFLALAAVAALLALAGFVVLNGQLGFTSTVILATSVVCLYFPVETWLENRRILKRAEKSAKTLYEFLDQTGGVGQSADAEFLPALMKRLEFDNVTLKDPTTGRVLLDEFTLTVHAGQRIALVGPDELEKHAVLYLIPRFFDPTAGEIRIDRHNLRWVTLDSLRAQIGMVIQNSLVFNDTVANNIGCGDPSYSLPQIIEAAKVAHAHKFIQKLPKGYETQIGELGHALNLGAKFRIALARAILRDPAIMIIEEPTSALDEDTKSLLDDTFARVLPGRTVIFLPHRLSTIRHCDRVFLIYKGRVEASGEHRELISTSELYRHLQYLEFNEFAGILPPSSLADAVATVDT